MFWFVFSSNWLIFPNPQFLPKRCPIKMRKMKSNRDKGSFAGGGKKKKREKIFLTLRRRSRKSGNFFGATVRPKIQMLMAPPLIRNFRDFRLLASVGQSVALLRGLKCHQPLVSNNSTRFVFLLSWLFCSQCEN
jgi:hypothetical protein